MVFHYYLEILMLRKFRKVTKTPVALGTTVALGLGGLMLAGGLAIPGHAANTCKGEGVSGGVSWDIKEIKENEEDKVGICTLTLAAQSGRVGTLGEGQPWEQYRKSVEKIVVDEETSRIEANSNSKGLFSHMTRLEDGKFENAEKIDTSEVTSMESIFEGTDKLKSLPSGVETWVTTKVTDMSKAFKDTNFTSIDVSNWKVRTVTDMTSMFEGTQNVTDIGTGWTNFKSLKTTKNMFKGSSLNNFSFNTDIFPELTTTEGMFEDAGDLSSVSVDNWSAPKLANTSKMFKSASGDIPGIDLSGWQIETVTDMSSMFEGAAGLTTIDVTGWNVSSVTNMKNMFASTTNLTGIKGIENWDVSSVKNMEGMFRNVSKLVKLPLDNWVPAEDVNITNVFSGMRNLITLDLSNWNTTEAQRSGMLNGTTALEIIDLGTFTNIEGSGLPAIVKSKDYDGLWKQTLPVGSKWTGDSDALMTRSTQGVEGTYRWAGKGSEKPVGPSTPSEASQEIEITPSAPKAGDLVLVKGIGWIPKEDVNVFVYQVQTDERTRSFNEPIAEATTVVDKEGKFSTTIRMPKKAKEGEYQIVVRQGELEESKDFVIEPGEETGDETSGSTDTEKGKDTTAGKDTTGTDAKGSRDATTAAKTAGSKVTPTGTEGGNLPLVAGGILTALGIAAISTIAIRKRKENA